MKFKKRVLTIKRTEDHVYIKINKKALEKLLAKIFWFIVIFVSFIAFILWFGSLNALQNIEITESTSFHDIWNAAKVPLATFISCAAWLGMMTSFIYFARKR